MEATITWKNNMCFEGRVDDHTLHIDANSPLGHHEGPTPKELLVMALAANAGMDVIGLLKKFKQNIQNFRIEVSAHPTEDGYPIIFREIELILMIDGTIEEAHALRAIELSQNTYCGVSAMLCKSVPIKWRLFVNGVESGRGLADFEMGEEFFFSSFEG